MEISNEIKCKVFAQYLGQKCKTFNPLLPNKTGVLVRVDLPEYLVIKDEELLHHDQTVDGVKLILKPLSDISDEDAIEVAKIFGWSNIATGKGIVGRIFEDVTDGTNRVTGFKMLRLVTGFKMLRLVTGFKMLRLIDFLRIKGYDLPHYLLGGKTLYESELSIYLNQ